VFALAAADNVLATGPFDLLIPPAAVATIELARELGTDLVAMGTRDNTGLTHGLLGGVTERTVRDMPRAVLTVKAAYG
jgi:nucleotide-binding universal stress UspA family protein